MDGYGKSVESPELLNNEKIGCEEWIRQGLVASFALIDASIGPDHCQN